LLATLRKDTRLALACGLTLPQARLRSAAIQDWKQRLRTETDVALDLPTVFAIGL
jgi:16S rRNA (cytidine1402-2'-O)-methyltransferase